MEYWPFGDQYRVVLPNTLENVAIALVLMIIVSIILIPHPLCSLCVAMAIVSIDVGVIGYMTLWDVALDTISMITIIMSIGFSVDFTAHISYGYVALSQERDPVKRMQVVLGARSWPVFQACLATILGILALAGVEAYMIVTFFKTVFLVMLIGLVHALVFLPVGLNLLIEPLLKCGYSRRDSLDSVQFPKVDIAKRYGISRTANDSSSSSKSSNSGEEDPADHESGSINDLKKEKSQLPDLHF